MTRISAGKDKQGKNKDLAQSSGVEGGCSTEQDSVNHDATVYLKLEILLAVVNEVGNQPKEHDSRLCKQEKRVSVHKLLGILSPLSSLKSH